MAAYTYSESTIASLDLRARRIRLGFFSIVSLIFAADIAFMLWPFRSGARYAHAEELWAIAIFSSCVTLLTQPLLRRRGSRQRSLDRLRSFFVEVAATEVRTGSRIGGDRSLDRDEIVRAEEPPWGAGLYLRSPNRYRWLLIPRRLDDYQQIKTALMMSGVRISRSWMLPNWEEFVFVLLFISTLGFDLFCRNRFILEMNVLLSLLIGVVGLFIVTAGWRDMPNRRKAQIGCFLPLACAAVSFFVSVN